MMWAGRFTKQIDERVNDFNSSIKFDSRMYKSDIEGSIAHATMLGECGIIEKSESEKIVEGLKGILADIESGALEFDPTAEDIHTSQSLQSVWALQEKDFTPRAAEMTRSRLT